MFRFMTRRLGRFLFLFVVLFTFTVQASPEHFIILRHAEKPADDSDRHLSPKGYRRAEALAHFFTSSGFTRHFGTPAALYASNSEGGRSKRSIETLKPTAHALDLDIERSYYKGDENSVIREAMRATSLRGKTVVISWPHEGIPRLAESIGVAAPAEWPKGVFNRFWVISKSGGRWTFKEVPQRLLPGD